MIAVPVRRDAAARAHGLVSPAAGRATGCRRAGPRDQSAKVGVERPDLHPVRDGGSRMLAVPPVHRFPHHGPTDDNPAMTEQPTQAVARWGQPHLPHRDLVPAGVRRRSPLPVTRWQASAVRLPVEVRVPDPALGDQRVEHARLPAEEGIV